MPTPWGKQFKIRIDLLITKTRTTAYIPQCHRLVERLNQALLSMLATTVADHPFDWEEALLKIAWCTIQVCTLQLVTHH